MDARPPEYYPSDNQHGHRVRLLIYRADTQVSQLLRVLNARWITGGSDGLDPVGVRLGAAILVPAHYLFLFDTRNTALCLLAVFFAILLTLRCRL